LQVGAALAPRAAAATPAAHAEQIIEYVGKGGGEIRAEACRGAAHAVLEGGVAETIVGGALVGVFEDFVGLVDFLEPVFRVLVTWIAVGMAHHRLLAESRLDLGLARRAFDGEALVVAALGHHRIPN